MSSWCCHGDISAGDNRSPWVRVRVDDGSWFFFHLQRLDGVWERPSGFLHNSVFLDRDDIQVRPR